MLDCDKQSLVMSWGGKRNNIVFVSILWHSENVGIYNWEASRPLQSLIPLCALSVYSHFLLSCAWSWWCWFRAQCTSHSPVCDGALQRSCCAAPWPLGLPEDSALPWEHSDPVLHSDSVLWDTPGPVADFREWSGEGGLFTARDINQPKPVDCEFLVGF